MRSARSPKRRAPDFLLDLGIIQRLECAQRFAGGGVHGC
jgi:hypothetical protein